MGVEEEEDVEITFHIFVLMYIVKEQLFRRVEPSYIPHFLEDHFDPSHLHSIFPVCCNVGGRSILLLS